MKDFKLIIDNETIAGYESINLVSIPQTPHPLEDKFFYIVEITYPDGGFVSHKSDKFQALFDENYHLYEFSLLSSTPPNPT